MNRSEESTIRFIAHSAQEAAAIVRERLGPEGRVISVDQVMGSGLKRFVSAPRLQIVAKRISPAEVTAPTEKTTTAATPENLITDSKISQPPSPSVSESDGANSRHPKFTCRSLLLQAGFSARLMARLEGAEHWRAICELPAEEGLPRAIAWLRQYRAKPEPFSADARIAFIGYSGAGKTAALCKFLAREIFLYERTPEVLQLETGKPHMDSGLSMYCDIMGVSCHEDPSRLTGSGSVLIDVPGFSPTAKKEQTHLTAALDSIGAENRILVMNAAYEDAILQKQTELGKHLGASHRAYTHLDEVEDVSKIWAGVLDPDCPTLFFSNGQNVVGNLIEDSFGYLIERTFPR